MTSALHRQDTAPIAHRDIIVLDYLAALWAATEDLDPELRDELMTAVADHIARRRVETHDDAEHIITLLGPVEHIAAAARRGRPPVHLMMPVGAPVPPAPPAPRVRHAGGAGAVEWTGVTLLTAGSIMLPVVGPLAGMLLISSSERYTRMQKVAAWLLASVPAVFGALLMVLAVEASELDFIGVAYLATIAGSMTAGLTLVPGLFTRRPAADAGR